MFGVPRWGQVGVTSNNAYLFWKDPKVIQNTNND